MLGIEPRTYCLSPLLIHELLALQLASLKRQCLEPLCQSVFICMCVFICVMCYFDAGYYLLILAI